MKTLVTGASGFVGPYLLSFLEAQGHNVIGLGSDNGPCLTDASAWADAMGDHRPELVFHLAGWSNVGASWDDPTKCFSINATGTLAVLEACRLASVRRVVVVSSADVYGQPEAAEPFQESMSCHPVSPYGLGKHAAEQTAKYYWQNYGLETVIARPFNHLGPGQTRSFVAASFAEQLALLERKGGGVLSHGDLSAQRDFTDVRDVVRAYLLLAQHGKAGETYNICSGKSISIETLLKTMLEEATVTIETQLDPNLLRPSKCPVRVGSPEKIFNETGWTAEIPFAQTIADLLASKRTLL